LALRFRCILGHGNQQLALQLALSIAHDVRRAKKWVTQRIFPRELLRVFHAMFLRNSLQQGREFPCPGNPLREDARKPLQQIVRAGAKPRQFDVVAILQKIQNAFVAVSLDANVQKAVVRGALRCINPEGVFGVAHIKNVHGQFGLSALEVLVQQNLEVVEQINICPAIHVLIKVIRAVKRRSALRGGIPEKWGADKSQQMLLGNIGGLRAGSAAAACRTLWRKEPCSQQATDQPARPSGPKLHYNIPSPGIGGSEAPRMGTADQTELLCPMTIYKLRLVTGLCDSSQQ